MMLTLKNLTAFVLAATMSVCAQAAVTCVINNASGKFEGRVPGPEFAKRTPGNECDINSTRASVRDVQTAIKAPGTIIANVAMLSFPSDAQAATVKPQQLAGAENAAAPASSKAERAPAGDASAQGIDAQADAAPAVMEEWKIKREDRTIRASLERWGKAAGWEVSWEVPRKVPASFEATFSGPFDVAVDKLMQALRGSDYPLIGCFYEDNKVVRILRRGEIKKCYE